MESTLGQSERSGGLDWRLGRETYYTQPKPESLDRQTFQRSSTHASPLPWASWHGRCFSESVEMQHPLPGCSGLRHLCQLPVVAIGSLRHQELPFYRVIRLYASSRCSTDGFKKALTSSPNRWRMKPVVQGLSIKRISCHARWPRNLCRVVFDLRPAPRKRRYIESRQCSHEGRGTC